MITSSIKTIDGNKSLKTFSFVLNRFSGHSTRQVNFRRFEHDSWYAQCGAKCFEDNTTPFICELELDEGKGATIIVDMMGVDITVGYFNPKTEEQMDDNFVFSIQTDSFEESLQKLFVLLEIRGCFWKEVLEELGWLEV